MACALLLPGSCWRQLTGPPGPAPRACRPFKGIPEPMSQTTQATPHLLHTVYHSHGLDAAACSAAASRRRCPRITRVAAAAAALFRARALQRVAVWAAAGRKCGSLATYRGHPKCLPLFGVVQLLQCEGQRHQGHAVEGSCAGTCDGGGGERRCGACRLQTGPRLQEALKRCGLAQARAHLHTGSAVPCGTRKRGCWGGTARRCQGT
jgi:hypothetical protein